MDQAFLYVGNIHVKVEAERQAIDVIAGSISYEVENAEIIKRRQYNKTGHSYWLEWDGRKSFFDRRSKTFLTGLLPEVISALRIMGIQYKVLDQRRPPAGLPADCSEGFTLRNGQGGHIELYDFQQGVCEALLSRKRGIAKLATGSGKTECGIAITKAFNLPTLFLTHKLDLLHQTAQRFKDRLPVKMADKIGIIGDGIYDIKPITIATVQTLFSYFKKDRSALTDELRQFRLLIIDEAHRSGSKQFHEVASACENAYFRLGLTATPFMAGNIEADMYLKGVTGNIIMNVSNKELIEKGLLAQPYFMFVNVREPDNIGWLTDYTEIYDHGITNNAYRNNLIARKLKSLNGKYHPLVIVYKVKHGDNLLKSLQDVGLKAVFIKGANSHTQRVKALKQLAEGKIDVIIATNIFDEGIDVKEVDCVVMAAGNKSAPALFQKAGRTMRKKDDGKHALIIDFIDRTHEKLFQHSKERFEIVRKEAGFQLIENRSARVA